MPLVALAAGDMPALLVASEKTYHQPWRPPCGVTIPVDPSSKSEMTVAVAAQAPGLVPPVPVLPPVLPPPTQLPLEQLCPVPHLLPHEPQFVVVVMSTQLPLQTIWLEVPQLQEPLTQVEPPVQALPQVPQSAEFVFELQAPSEHLLPDEQVDEQVPSLSQTSVPVQALQLEPQCCAFDATHDPPQDTNPLV